MAHQTAELQRLYARARDQQSYFQALATHYREQTSAVGRWLVEDSEAGSLSNFENENRNLANQLRLFKGYIDSGNIRQACLLSRNIQNLTDSQSFLWGKYTGHVQENAHERLKLNTWVSFGMTSLGLVGASFFSLSPPLLGATIVLGIVGSFTVGALLEHFDLTNPSVDCESSFLVRSPHPLEERAQQDLANDQEFTKNNPGRHLPINPQLLFDLALDDLHPLPFEELELRQEWALLTAEIQQRSYPDDMSFRDRVITLIQQVFSQTTIGRYGDKTPNMLSFLSGKRGNCEARARLITALLIVSGLVTPPWQITELVWKDHLEVVLYNSETDETFHPFSGQDITIQIQNDLYATQLLLTADLLKRHHVPITNAQDLIVRPADPIENNQPAPQNQHERGDLHIPGAGIYPEAHTFYDENDLPPSQATDAPPATSIDRHIAANLGQQRPAAISLSQIPEGRPILSETQNLIERRIPFTLRYIRSQANDPPTPLFISSDEASRYQLFTPAQRRAYLEQALETRLNIELESMPYRNFRRLCENPQDLVFMNESDLRGILNTLSNLNQMKESARLIPRFLNQNNGWQNLVASKNSLFTFLRDHPDRLLFILNQTDINRCLLFARILHHLETDHDDTTDLPTTRSLDSFYDFLDRAPFIAPRPTELREAVPLPQLPRGITIFLRQAPSELTTGVTETRVENYIAFSMIAGDRTLRNPTRSFLRRWSALVEQHYLEYLRALPQRSPDDDYLQNIICWLALQRRQFSNAPNGFGTNECFVSLSFFIYRDGTASDRNEFLSKLSPDLRELALAVQALPVSDH